MNAVPTPRRRSLASLLLGVLAMGGSLAAVGALILSDVASAETVEEPAVQQVAPDKRERPAVNPPPSEGDVAQVLGTQEEAPKPVKKKRTRKPSKMNLGRFEGY